MREARSRFSIPPGLAHEYDFCACGNQKAKASVRCVECFDRFLHERSNIPTRHQLKAAAAFAKTGCVKLAALDLGKSDKTVEYHLDQLRRRLGIGSLYHLCAWAFIQGMADPSCIFPDAKDFTAPTV